MRPLSLARYIAASASRISSSALVGWPEARRATAIPIEALTKWSTPCIEKGWAKAEATRSAIAMASRVVGEAVDQDPELVAAEAGDDVAGAQVGAQPRGDGAQQGVAGVVAEAVVDELEVVEVEEEDPDRRAGDRGAAERVVDRVDEAEPVGQAGERVVEDAVAERAVGGVALEGVGEDVGGGFEEGDVLGAEAARFGGVDVEDAEGAVLAVDHHRQRAGGAERADRGRHREAGLLVPVGDDDRRRQSRAPRRRGIRGPPETRRPEAIGGCRRGPRAG